MATVPTFSELYNSVITDLQNKLGITSLLGKLVLPAFAAVQAGKLKLMYIVAAKVQNNLYADLADEETLLRIGEIRLGRILTPAIAGEYSCTVTGSSGAIIPASTTFKSLDSSTSPGKLFILDSSYTLITGVNTISLRSLEGGSDSRLEVDDQLQLTQPIASVDSYATVTNVDVTPIEGETIEEYRDEVLDSYRLEAQGGSRADFVLWSKAVSGIREAYPYVKIGSPGEINLYLEANLADSIDGKGTPTAALLQDVYDAIELDERPMGVFDIFYKAITPLDVDIDIVNLSDPTLLTTIQTSIESHLFTVRPFIDGVDNINFANKGYLYTYEIAGIVRDTIGGTNSFDSITVTVSGTPITNSYEFTDGDIPYLNSLTTS